MRKFIKLPFQGQKMPTVTQTIFYQGVAVKLEAEDPETLEEISRYFKAVKKPSSRIEITQALTTQDVFVILELWSQEQQVIESRLDVLGDPDVLSSLHQLSLLKWDTHREYWVLSELGSQIAKQLTMYWMIDIKLPGDEKTNYYIPWYQAGPVSKRRKFYPLSVIFRPLIQRYLYHEEDILTAYAKADLWTYGVFPRLSEIDWSIVDRIFEESFEVFPCFREIHELHKVDRKIRNLLFPGVGLLPRDNEGKMPEDKHTQLVQITEDYTHGR